MVYELAPKRTALLIIDAQREYFNEDGALFTPHAGEILANLPRILGGARDSGTQVIFTRHVNAADGSDAERMADFDDAPSFVEGTKGVEILKTSGVTTLIVTGLITQYCSVTTTRHGHDLNYRMVFVVDANAGPELPDAGFGAVPPRRRPSCDRRLTGERHRRAVIDTEATVNALRSQTLHPG
jgi:nicotinamidase-related amidase